MQFAELLELGAMFVVADALEMLVLRIAFRALGAVIALGLPGKEVLHVLVRESNTRLFRCRRRGRWLLGPHWRALRGTSCMLPWAYSGQLRTGDPIGLSSVSLCTHIFAHWSPLA